MTINTNSYGWVLPIVYVKAEIRSNGIRIIALTILLVNTFFIYPEN